MQELKKRGTIKLGMRKSSLIHTPKYRPVVKLQHQNCLHLILLGWKTPILCSAFPFSVFLHIFVWYWPNAHKNVSQTLCHFTWSHKNVKSGFYYIYWRNKYMFLNFKLSPCSECCLFSFG